ncbi:MAG: DUF559 domain-containing protein [Deltaproteobacteria bacterium]|nr:DUF559 domain-containing protein [Deltaproteobacteria bacterium]
MADNPVFPKPGQLKAVIYRPTESSFVLARHRPDEGQPLAVEITISEYSATITDSLVALAEAAKAVWPDWYQTFGPSIPLRPDSARAGSSLADDRDWLVAAPDRVKGVDRVWLREVTKAVEKYDRVPYFPKLLPELQASQLGLALAGLFNSIHLLVPAFLGPDKSAIALVKGLEWLAKETLFDVTVFLPEGLAAHEIFSPLLYGAALDPADRPDLPAQPPPMAVTGAQAGDGPERPRESPGAPKGPEAKASPAPDPDDYLLPPLDPIPAITAPKGPGAETRPTPGRPGHPFLGKPHPGSPIEQILADALNADDRLRGLFLFNHPVKARERTFIVDFYWPVGALVVEADGYRYHAGFWAFQNDRLRDYYLTVSGQTVLRLTGFDIMNDIEGTLGRIREMVKFLSKKRNLTL